VAEECITKNEKPSRPANQAADRIRAVRLWLHRRLDQLLDEATDPGFSGQIEMTILSKKGILGEPRTGNYRYGVTEF
jgi:hypothetical protein